MKSIDISFCHDKFLTGDGNKAVFATGGYAEFFEALLNNGIAAKFPQAQIPLSKGKILARIQNKLDDLKPTNGKEVGKCLDVEEAEYDLIKGVFCEENSAFHVSQLQLAVHFGSRVEEAAKENKETHKVAELKAV